MVTLKQVAVGGATALALAGAGVALMGNTPDQQARHDAYVQLENQWRTDTFSGLVQSVDPKHRGLVTSFLNTGAPLPNATSDDVQYVADQVTGIWHRRLNDAAQEMRLQGL